MKKIYLSVLMLSCVIFNSCNNANAERSAGNSKEVSVEIDGSQEDATLYEDVSLNNNDPVATSTSKADTKIQVAILLDTSSSMEGLIEQAKSRLWNIVNTLTTLKFKGKDPMLEIALYEYGNNGIHNDEYIRQVVPLSTDLDLISQKLFALTIYGGSEYCGAVISKATKQLEWGKNNADIKLIYIAGNEPFTQGSIHYVEAINEALAKNIYVNTIHCGEVEEGIRGMWRDGATKGKGKYFNIDHNARVRYIVTPYDDRIDQCNIRLNATYVSYGREGEAKRMNQAAQDRNAGSISSANKAERTVSKAQSAYKNESWDLVDLASENEQALRDIKQSELPKELQGKSETEIKAHIAQKKEERAAIQQEIETLAKQRQAYIDEEMKKQGDSGDDLGKAITQSVLDVATAKGYTTE